MVLNFCNSSCFPKSSLIRSLISLGEFVGLAVKEYEPTDDDEDDEDDETDNKRSSIWFSIFFDFNSNLINPFFCFPTLIRINKKTT